MDMQQMEIQYSAKLAEMSGDIVRGFFRVLRAVDRKQDFHDVASTKGLMRQEYRHRHRFENDTRCASEQHFTETGMAVATHHQKIGAAFRGMR